MNDEPTTSPISEDDDQPATKGDVRKSQEELAGMMAKSFHHAATKNGLHALDQRMDAFEGRMDKFDRRLERFESSQAATLRVVQSIDQQLKEWKRIPAKVERLHRAVFPHR